MSTRKAQRKLTGAPVGWTEVVMGERPDGSRGVTVHAKYRESWPFTDPDLLDRLALDLCDAAEYLRGDR